MLSSLTTPARDRFEILVYFGALPSGKEFTHLAQLGMIRASPCLCVDRCRWFSLPLPIFEHQSLKKGPLPWTIFSKNDSSGYAMLLSISNGIYLFIDIPKILRDNHLESLHDFIIGIPFHLSGIHPEFHV